VSAPVSIGVVHVLVGVSMTTPVSTSPDHMVLLVSHMIAPVITITDHVNTIDPVNVDPVFTIPEDESVPVQESRDPVLSVIIHEPLLVSIDPVLSMFPDPVDILVQSSSLIAIERTILSRCVPE
jgi:hypothetical protein